MISALIKIYDACQTLSGFSWSNKEGDFFLKKKKREKKLNHIFHITPILIPHNFLHVVNLRQWEGVKNER